MNLDSYNYEIDESFQTYEFIMATTDKRMTTVTPGGNTVVSVTDRAKFTSATGKGTVNAELKNYANAPVFLKKAAEAKAEIDRVGLPKRKI